MMRSAVHSLAQIEAVSPISKSHDTPGKRGQGKLAAKESEIPFYLKYLRNAVQGGVMAAGGVIASQVISRNPEVPFQLNWKEVVVMSLIAMLWKTPVLMTFFSYLHKLDRSVMDKVIIDQFIFSIPYNCGTIALRFLFFNDGNIADLPAFLMRTFPRVQSTAWLFWIPAKMIIINYVPPSNTLFITTLTSLVWSIVLMLLLKR